MFEIDENDPLTGSPRSKFFEMLTTANKNLISETLENRIERYVAMELLLQENYKDELETILRHKIYTNPDTIEEGKNDFFIGFVGELLSQHE